MKKFFIVAAAMLLTFTAFAQDGKSIYDKYANKRGVESVYISPAMFQMIGRLPKVDLEVDDVDLTPVVKSLNGMYILDVENSSLVEPLVNDVNQFMNQKAYELILEVRDDDELVRMYTLRDRKATDIINGLIILTVEYDECTFIYIDGAISAENFDLILRSAR